jgi:transcriptional regulator with XRE-family HTH domain
MSQRDDTLMYQMFKTIMPLDQVLAELDPKMGDMAKRKYVEAESFGERLRRLREARGFTQRELAEAAETSQRMVAYYETHSGTPAGPVLLKLARALKVGPHELMGLKAEQHNTASSSPQNLRLWRKLKRVEKLPPAQRRTVVQLIDALVEGEARKKQHG